MIENEFQNTESIKLKINTDKKSKNDNLDPSNQLLESKENLIDTSDKNKNKKKEEEEEKKKLLEKEKENQKSIMRKSKLNNITFVQNLKEYFPEEISKEEIRCMVMNALSGYIVNNKKNFVAGKTVTREQSEAIANLVFEKVKSDQNSQIEEYDEDNLTNEKNLLDDLKIKVCMSDLTSDVVKKIFFKNKENIPPEEVSRTIQNVSQGSENVKVLTIELLAK